MNNETLQKQIEKLHVHSISGTQAVGWGLKQLTTLEELRMDRILVLDEADRAFNDAHTMKKIQRG